MVKRCTLLAVAAFMTAPTGVVAQPLPSNLAAPRSPQANFRLSPDLGDATTAIRSALGALPGARVAEPADYILTTKREFPQTLIAVDADQSDNGETANYSTPVTVELGNLVLGDYAQPLNDLAARVARAKALVARAERGRGRPGEMEICVQPLGDPPACNYNPGTGGPIEISADPIAYYESSILVRSHAPGPRYIAVYFVDPAFGLRRLSLKGRDPSAPLAAGMSAETGPIEVDGAPDGKYHIALFWSERPFDGDAWQSDLAWAGVTGSTVQHSQSSGMPQELGGGMPVLEKMAPWMAEMYSTVPYTKAEKAADLLKAPDQREHLNERSDEELDHRCGGSLIAPDIVVTAAHCVAKGKYAGDGMAQVLKERRIRLGSKFLGQDGTTYAVAGVAVPADYSPDTNQNDIALLLLKGDRDTDRFMTVPTIAIGSAPLTAGASLTTYGWGFTGEVPSGQNPLFDALRDLQHNPDFLRFGRLAVMDWSKCHERMAMVASGMVCAVAPDAVNGGVSAHNVFTCRGDSGGPLVRKTRRGEELVGITSWSMGCGWKDYASVFTNVTKYGAWIRAARQQLKPGLAIRVDEPTPGESASPSHH